MYSRFWDIDSPCTHILRYFLDSYALTKIEILFSLSIFLNHIFGKDPITKLDCNEKFKTFGMWG